MQSAARHSGKNATIVCLAPDVCKTQVGGSAVPIPYMIISRLDWSERTVSSIQLTGLKAFNMNARTNKVTGNEPGKMGGVKSGVNLGWCRPQSNKVDIFIDGAELIQNDNLYEMNCNGPDGPGNTIGRLVYYE
ncbi:DUF4150 domain-containing protein [Paracoccus sp. M683]|uniref:DUF4150 domain-containing protein n=1 Tax=Paracoccus sp. M683 TaxID=2594268 RepID=UPI00117F7594|nr:DUF4150 domain-containing protein [Paracoccus sp. M683]TRW95369.1 DUF4150 domain-containing protein [Paracoccus sp. M683]